MVTRDSNTMASRPEMREDDESGFCKFFRNLPNKDDDTIQIFDRGDYYSAHGEDAKFIANSARLKATVASVYADTSCRSTEPQLYYASWDESPASNQSP